MKKSAIIIAFIFLVSLQLYSQTWSPIIRLTWNWGSSGSPDIARGSGTRLHIVWTDSSVGSYFNICYKRSFDGGTTWSSLKKLTWDAGNSFCPSIAVDSTDGVHVVWSSDVTGNNEVYYKYSTDGGTTWSAKKRLTWSRTGYGVLDPSPPKIAADTGDGIYVVWDSAENGNFEIYSKYSTDKGLTWSARQRHTWNSGDSWYPDIVADINDIIHIVWDDDTVGTPEVYHKRSVNKGLTWSASNRLTWVMPSITYCVHIAADLGGGIHIAYRDKYPAQVHYKRSLDGGITWSSPKQLTWTSVLSWCWDIAALDTGIHVVWGEGGTFF